MKLKDISRTATFAWDQSSSSNPLLVTGAIAGALDENFSNESQLEIWAPDFGESQGLRLGGDGQGPAGSITVNSRFNRLAWSAPMADKKKGVIAAGMETGEVCAADEARFFQNNKHTGPVRGLDFNPIQKNLLLTGGVNAELYIFDLNNPSSAPITPGPTSNKLNEITSLQWNPTVSRVFAASSSSGYTSVWDLKAQKEIVSLQYGGGAAKGSDVVAGAAGLQMGKRRGMSDVCWHPESATRLITASEDDESPIIMLWDLRNTRAPEKILSGHHKGVLSVSWCKQDADLLLSCGKDNRTLCWNPHSGEIIGELPATSDWSFQTTWCPRNPDLLATAAFDGHIGIHSLQTTQLPEQPSNRLGDKASADDIFGALTSQEQPEASVLSLKQPPKWLRRPVSATFGYGGLLASTTTVSGKSVVQLRKVVSEDAIIERAEKLSEANGDKDKLEDLCNGRVSDAKGDEAWKALQTLFKANSRTELTQLLGFSKADVEKQVLEAINKLPGADKPETPVKDKEEEEDRAPTPTPARSEAGSVAPSELDSKSDAGSKLFDDGPNSASADFFSSMAAGSFKNPVLDHIMNQKSEVAESSRAATMGSRASSVRSENIKDNTFRIYPAGESDTDKLITQALVLGDFASAVDLCLASERFADALLLAVRGGADLLQSTQKAYFARKTASTPFLRVYQSIVTEDLADIVQNADLNEWRVIFAVVCTFAKDAEFNNLADQLGQRLQYKSLTAEDKAASRTARQDATLCYLAARKLEKVVSIWSEEMKEEEESVNTTRYTAHALALQSFIEKVAVFSAATGYVDQDLLTPTESREAAEAGARTYKLASLYDRYYEYADLLAMQGLVDLAAQFVKLTPADYKGSSAGDLEQARDRLLRAAGVQDGATRAAGAFGASAVASSSKASASAPTAARGYAAAPSSAYQPTTPIYNQTPANVPTVPAAQPAAYQPNRSFVPAPPQPAAFGGDSPYAPTQSYQAPQSSAPYAPSNQQPSAYAPSGYAPSAPNGYGQPSYSYNAPPPANLPPPPRADQGNGTSTPPLIPASQRRDLPGWNDAPSLTAPPKRPQSAAKDVRAAPIMSPFPMAEGTLASGPAPFGAPPAGPPSSFTPPPPRAAPGVLPPPPKGGPRPPSAQNGARQAQQQQSQPPAQPMNAAPQFVHQQPTPPPGPPRGGPPTGSPAPPPQAAQAPPPPRGPPRAGPPPNALQAGLAGPPPPRALSPLGPPGRQMTPMQGMQGMSVGPRPPSAQSQRSAGPPPPGAPRAGPPPPGRTPSVGPPPPQLQQQQQQQASMPTSPPLGSGSPVTPAPAPVPVAAKPRHPAGDRSHITPEGRPIYETLDRAMNKVKQANLPAHLKKIIDDTERRLNILFDSLNNDAVPKDALSKTGEIARAIGASDLNSALALHVELMTVASGDVASWAPGVKQLIRLSV